MPSPSISPPGCSPPCESVRPLPSGLSRFGAELACPYCSAAVGISSNRIEIRLPMPEEHWRFTPHKKTHRKTVDVSYHLGSFPTARANLVSAPYSTWRFWEATRPVGRRPPVTLNNARQFSALRRRQRCPGFSRSSGGITVGRVA